MKTVVDGIEFYATCLPRGKYIRCDICGNTEFTAGIKEHDGSKTRLEASKEGWIFKDGKDTCPSCIEQQ